MKNRTITGVICIALALVLMFGVSPFISMMSAKKIDVVQVNKNIAEGQRISEDDVVVVEIGQHGTPDALITSTEEVIGKYANADLFPGLNLLPDMLTDSAYNTESVLKTLNKDNVAISITVPSFAAALSAKLENGDIVSVNVTTEDETLVPDALRYVRIITTTTSEGIDQEDLDSAPEDTDPTPVSITLLVSPLQAKLLAEYEANASMHLSLVSRGNPDAAKEYLAEQSAILERIVAEMNEQLAEEGLLPENPVNEPAETEPEETNPEENGGAENG